MDGKILLYQLRQLLEEGSTSSYLDDRTSYDFLNEAATEYAIIARALTNSQTITTVADQTDYALNSDYLYMYLTDSRNQYIAHYNTGTYITDLLWREPNAFTYNANTTSSAVPSRFTIKDGAAASTVSGTITAAGASVLGECTLTDATQTFLTAVSAGDTVHNTTDSSDGIVLEVVSNTALKIALFGGTDNDFDPWDEYVIVPQGKKKFVLDPPPSTAGHTITFNYIAKPAPVYSYTRRFRFDSIAMPAIIKYAAWLYKYRDREPNMGDRWYQHWERTVRKNMSITNKSFNRYSWGVNYTKTSFGDRSMR
jgi:hypothetical protein